MGAILSNGMFLFISIRIKNPDFFRVNNKNNPFPSKAH